MVHHAWKPRTCTDPSMPMHAISVCTGALPIVAARHFFSHVLGASWTIRVPRVCRASVKMSLSCGCSAVEILKIAILVGAVAGLLADADYTIGEITGLG
jgi:hypothetical protein